MGKLLDQIIVIDIEATCWQGSPPPGQTNEIIEIGICPIDVVAGKRLEQRSILVKPQNSSVSPFCTELTTLTQEQVERGISFAEVCTVLRQEYQTKERVWASYGDYDRNQFERQCRTLDIKSPFGAGHLNVKSLFALVHALPREVGMAEALRMAQLPLEGTHHRGGDDAWNIAHILLTLLLRARTH